MKESTTYQAILQEGREEGREEGRAEEARSLILRLGVKRMGNASSEVTAALRGVTDLAHLERMSDRLFEVESWDDLLATD